jgi:uncharacterized phosphosugar-binding protein
MSPSNVGLYGELTLKKIADLQKSQSENLQKASKTIFDSLSKSGVWHLFGTGHSSIVVQEAFHRAGGLVPVNPWLEEYLMPQAGPRRNGPMEKLSGLNQVIFDLYKPQAGEVLTLVSNSGINPTIIEMAQLARKNKISTIGITNLEHSKQTPSRDKSKLKLFEVVDIVLDTGGVKGDAAVEIKGVDVPVGPLSSILNIFIINALTILICEEFAKAGLEAPVYLSANLPGGPERNRKLEEKYRSRILRLT